ncbi:hypothetical protein CPS_1810 [Colwellia psychrerythraea 34H]|uniref:Uncharacterized protein n=1 Tax=Colwellia psychrerythraea (strain 34H / ATCC BAA-681) TaxID=167879 RepID=Q484H4_COLP3|nr:hypothetical protein CPS_1810 [Colwellia psychrerythraea 34H]
MAAFSEVKPVGLIKNTRYFSAKKNYKAYLLILIFLVWLG